ncbi:MAG: HD domain-containing protein [Polyangiales bacterium]
MILRDPVHGLVSFEEDDERIVSRLLATREVQRLRRIRQLGLTSMVFPGAEHTRFAHAIGAAHVMTRLLGRLRVVEQVLPPELRVSAEVRRDAVAAALLHDIGHGPFSHLFEEVLPGARRHEAWSTEILCDPATDVHRTLASFDVDMPVRVSKLVRGDYHIGYLGRAVSGTLDVDRADYLLRDSHMTGVRYGLYDLDWLLEALNFATTKAGEWVVAVEGRKGLPPIEGFFLGRHFMFRQVYHHKTTRSAECLIRAMFVRMAELVRDGAAPGPIPGALEAAAKGQPVSLGDYLALDDVQLLYCVDSWSRGADPLLAELCRRLLARELPKTLPVNLTTQSEAEIAALHGKINELAVRRGLRPDLNVWFDVTRDVPYAEPQDDESDGLWVAIRHQPLRRLGDESFLLGELRNKTLASARFVFATELRDDVLRLVP